MWLLRTCEEYIGFDDRKIMIIGILIVAGITHPLISELAFLEYITSPIDVSLSILWTGTYWINLRFMMVQLRRRFPKIKQTPKRIILCSIVVLIAAPIISFVLGLFCFHVLGYEIAMDIFNKYTIIYILVFGIMAFYEATFYFHQYKLAIQETENLKTAQVQSQLENLRNQVSPHFLFNSLNTLMNLIPKDQDRAMTYLSKLSKFYRYTVSNRDESLVPISTEVENAITYADLLHERFGNNITIEIECAKASGKMTLPLSLQLLIENAVKHNIVSKSKPLNINIYCGDDGYIHVENNLQPKIQAVSSTGSGLANIKKRFAYFSDQAVLINESDNRYHISLPLIDPV